MTSSGSLRDGVDVAIIGAGPYALSLATHLRARRIEHRIFGASMHAWRSMSPGMHLKSLGFATNVYTPDDYLTLPHFCRSRGEEDFEPIPIATFAEYGVIVQQTRVPYLEEVLVDTVSQEGRGFRVTLTTGEHIAARRVVVATGLSYFERVPPPFDALPPDLICHTAQRGEFSGFDGTDVTVVGAGQSALQAAALLHENGSEVRIVAREQVHWGLRGRPDSERSLIERLRVPMTVLGGGRDNWVLQHLPGLVHYMPDDRRLRFVHSHLGPGGAWWLRDRVEGVIPVERGTRVVAAVPEGSKVRLTLVENGEEPRDLVTEYVVVGTGYEVDVDRISFISRALSDRVRRHERAPALTRRFESSVPGLYFIGPSSAASFGPLFRFVAGAAYAVPVVAAHLARQRRAPVVLSER